MPDRLTILMQQTTKPGDPTRARAHIAGWSESHWTSGALVSGARVIINLLNARASLLNGQASIVGYRIGTYSISGNKLIPQGSSTAGYSQTGDPSYVCDVPGMSMLMSARTGAGPNAGRFAVRGIPDSLVVGGEYMPDDYYPGALSRFGVRLINDPWGFVGRDLSAASQPVDSISAGKVYVPNAAALGVARGDVVRFFRAKDDFGNPIQGAFRITATDFTLNSLTLAGLDPTILTTIPSGLIRVDKIAFFPYNSIFVQRIVTRKVGAPFEKYRGRRSKRPV